MTIRTDYGHRYELPIRNQEHADWCLEEATRRYGGRIGCSKGLYFVLDGRGDHHTDHVLRAVSAMRVEGSKL